MIKETEEEGRMGEERTGTSGRTMAFGHEMRSLFALDPSYVNVCIAQWATRLESIILNTFVHSCISMTGEHCL